MVELTHPLISSGTLPEGRAGRFYRARIEVSKSIGHLVSQTEDGRAYQLRFRNGDDLVFELAGAPPGISIDASTGALSGTLPRDSAGTYELGVKVTNRRSGIRDERKIRFVVSE
jgi:hypothetical protein